jgi:hypothetical protein
MNENHYAGLRSLAMQTRNIERVVQGIESQIRSFKEAGWPPVAAAWSEAQVPALRKVLAKMKRACAAYGTDTEIGNFVKDTTGLGPAVFLVIGLLPRLEDFTTVAGLWKYCGLHVDGGRAPRLKRGQVGGFSPLLRSYVLYRLAEPAIKKASSPYRALYLTRKLHTLETHPEMLEKGQCPTCDMARGGEKGRDCSNVGGIHWTKGHRHRDALRVAGKGILRDLWCVAHGRPLTPAAEVDHALAALVTDGAEVDDSPLVEELV